MPNKKKNKDTPQKESINNVQSKNQTKKRKNALVSPDNFNEHLLPIKRPDSRVSPSGTMASQPQTGFFQPMNMSAMDNMNSYQTPAGAFYTSQPNTPLNTQYINASPQFQTNVPQACNTYNEKFQKSVLDQLMSLDNRLNKLDSIEKQLSNLTTKIENMDTRVTSLEGTVRDVGTRVTEVEVSRSFDSQTCEELKSKNAELDKALQAERNRIAKLTSEFESLKSVPDDIDDLRSRSMRCNLLFHGFPEEKSPAARKSENCAKLVLDYLKDPLKIPQAHENIKIERAHRLGAKYDHRKSRPIVVMFSHYPDKLLVKQKVQEAKKKYFESRGTTSDAGASHPGGADGSGSSDDRPSGTTPVGTEPMDEAAHTGSIKPLISVSDQFPKSIQDRRKTLLPALISAKKSGKTAYLSYDKLYIDNKMYTVDTVASSGYSTS